jgi:streptogramin lyase
MHSAEHCTQLPGLTINSSVAEAVGCNSNAVLPSAQVGHLLAIAQSQSRDPALPVITQVMQLLRNAKLAAGRRSSAAAAVAAAATAEALNPALGTTGARRAPSRPERPRRPKESRTTAWGIVVRTLESILGSAHWFTCQRCHLAGQALDGRAGRLYSWCLPSDSRKQ